MSLEQQVADALRTITFQAGTDALVALPMDNEHINRLAPRVAAAIQAAWRHPLAEAYALAALRGTGAP